MSGVDILVVEDNPSDAELLSLALKRRKLAYAVEFVRDGQEALDYLHKQNSHGNRKMQALPRLVLLDLKLPRLNGLDVLRAVRKDASFNRMPIVMLTSSAIESDVQQCREAGANGYVVKPVDFSEFSDALGTLIDYWLRLNRS